MMEINLENYEAFLLDYMEGNLSPVQVAALLIFLEEHPELEVDLDELTPVELGAAHDITFPDKNSLKIVDLSQPISPVNDEDFFVGYHEGVLRADLCSEVEDYLIRFPERQADFELYGKLKLIPQANIVFVQKGQLKKTRTVSLRPLWYSVAVAASLLIAFNLNFVSTQDSTGETEIANIVIEEQKGIPVTGVRPDVHPLNGINIKKVNTPENENIDKAKISPQPEVQVAVRPEIKRGNKTPQPKVTQPVLSSDKEDREVEIAEINKQPETYSKPDEIINDPINTDDTVEDQVQLAKSEIPARAGEEGGVGKFVSYLVKDRIMGDKDTTNLSLGQTVSTRITKAVGGDLAIEKNNDGEVLAYAFKLGKFEITRKTGKN